MGPSGVSVIIPVHNGESYLEDAIRSTLVQILRPDEVIIVDDGSTDASCEIARSYGPLVRYFYQPNSGAAAARNLGVEQAAGGILAFLDADDLWEPDKLLAQARVLATDDACDAVLGRVENFVSPELGVDQHRTLALSAGQSGDVHIGALAIRREAFLHVGWFDTRRRHGDFVDWWARAVSMGLAYTVLPDLVLRRRLHANNLTRREPQGRKEYLAILHAKLVAQRKHGHAPNQPPDGCSTR